MHDPVNFKALLSETTEREFELLQTIMVMQTRLQPTASALAREYGTSRQAMYQRLKRLRAKGLVEDTEPGQRCYAVTLTHNAVRLIEKALDAETKH